MSQFNTDATVSYSNKNPDPDYQLVNTVFEYFLPHHQKKIKTKYVFFGGKKSMQ